MNGALELDHPLDQAIWMALTTSQRDLAMGAGAARAFQPSYAPFCAVAAPTEESFHELAGLIDTPLPIALATLQALPALPWFDVVATETLDQMLAGRTAVAAASSELVVPLGEADVERIRALAALAKPGPFREDTHRLGPFVGIFDERREQLLAMAGERMRLSGFAEVSAVCVHPEARGRGFAAALVAAVVNGILARGEQAFLHVLADNHSAISLYQKLGFVRRAQFTLTVLQRNGVPL
jgi:ribosomal protein S18 acetylase RimI-like enzyme